MDTEYDQHASPATRTLDVPVERVSGTATTVSRFGMGGGVWCCGDCDGIHVETATPHTGQSVHMNVPQPTHTIALRLCGTRCAACVRVQRALLFDFV